ncbi:MAG: hypothetical protein LBI03_03320 [Clostridiales bacterium]|jgi:N-acetyl-gamma-glutamyl-phosphate reductase|nr:hypothetical protein [Clostridiales bacterium]
MHKIGIAGDTGMVGQELCKILENHSKVEITYKKNSTRQIGSPEDLELLFLATKDRESMETAKELLTKSTDTRLKIIDMSGAFRLDRESFEKWYHMEHICPELIEEAVYGMPALFREKVAAARLVANPGCYPSSVILPLAALSKFIEGEATIVSTSGNSGARRTKEETENEVTYSFGRRHKHVPEMEKYSGFRVNFTPIVIRSVFKGINTNIRIKLKDEIDSVPAEQAEEMLINAIGKAYVPQDLIFTVTDTGSYQYGTADVAGTNKLLLKIRVEDGYAYINSLLDNLYKGAAGQGVENMNIMLGLDRLESLMY